MRLRHSDDDDVVDLNLLGQGKWEKICGTQDTLVEVFGHIRLMTLDTLMKCIFSQETNCQINRSVTGGQKKTFVWHYINHLLTYPHFLSSNDDHYVKAMSEASKINFSHLYGFLLHHDIIFKFSPDGHRLQELSKILHQYAGISWVWVAQVHNSMVSL